MTDVGTVADLDEIRPIEETVSMETASAIVIAPTAPAIIGGDGISQIGETQTRIGDIGVTDVDTETENVCLIRALQLDRAAFLDTVEARFV